MGVEFLKDSAGNTTVVVDYLDRLWFCGCIPWKLEYRAHLALCLSGEGAVEGPALFGCTDVSGTRVVHRYLCTPREGGGTRLCDTVFISAPCLLYHYVVRTARAAHTASLAKLVALMAKTS